MQPPPGKGDVTLIPQRAQKDVILRRWELPAERLPLGSWRPVPLAPGAGGLAQGECQPDVAPGVWIELPATPAAKAARVGPLLSSISNGQ